MDTNCMTEGEPDHRLSSSFIMGHDWKFNEETALMVTSKRKEGNSVMAARTHGGYKDYIRIMVEKHM
eukprot:4410452-Ditylum_brightwellii.AAC.1